jgi:hypothetical protein
MKLATGGAGLVTQRIAIVITLIYAWVFWPTILISFVSDYRKGKPEKK